MITSADNRHLKEIRKLARRPARDACARFVAEGEDLLDAAAQAGWEAVYTLGDGGLAVSAKLLADVSALGSGTRAIGVYEQRWSVAKGPLCLYLHGVRDPGNVGTILRSAHAFGAASVALGPDCADPYGPKAVRASMGAIFRVALARAGYVGALPGELIALDAGASEELAGVHAPEMTLMIGGEREGLPASVREAATRTCAIRQHAGDSLNAAMAATVALYEVSRVRSR